MAKALKIGKFSVFQVMIKAFAAASQEPWSRQKSSSASDLARPSHTHCETYGGFFHHNLGHNGSNKSHG